MIEKNLLFTAVVAVLIFHASAQEIDNTSSWKNINADSYIRLSVDDDYFTGTDEQYSEGVNLEICMPWVKHFPLSKLLVRPRFSSIRYGIGIEQSGYTPFALPYQGIDYGDRPFAGTLFLKTFLVATDPQMEQRFSTTLSTGVIGPAAIAGKLQDDVHVITGNELPPGWKYQVQNDAILNYQVNYEKEVIYYKDYLIANAEGMLRAGTLSDKAAIGINVIAGYFESPFSTTTPAKRKFQVYVFDNPEIEFVGYDATLQGGVFNHSSPYVIPVNDVSRLLFMNRSGLVVVVDRFHIEYDESYVTQEFSTGFPHLWGSIQAAMVLDQKKKQ